jgi:hypothetical protein
MIKWITTYPVEATNAHWQKKKSVLDKIAKASRVTGLGASLTAAEEAYNEVDFDLLDVGTAGGKGGNPKTLATPDQIDGAKLKAETHLRTHVRPAREKMRLAAAEAETIHANKDKLFNATTVAAAASVAKALREREKLLMNIVLTDFDRRKMEKAKTARLVLERFAIDLQSALENADVFIQKVEKTPTPAVFNKEIDKASRKLTQMIGNVDKIKSQGANMQKEQPNAIFEVLEPWANYGLKVDKEASKEIVIQELAKYKKAVADIRVWWA